MRYEACWTKTAVKDLEKLEKRVVERIIERVEEALPNPFRYFKKLRTPSSPLYSLRVGDYRVIALIDHNRRIVVILAVEHRSRAYKRIA